MAKASRSFLYKSQSNSRNVEINSKITKDIPNPADALKIHLKDR